MQHGQIDKTQYSSLLLEKSRKSQEEFSKFDPPELTVFASPSSHFRMRAEFKIWQEGDSASYAMYAPGEHKKAVTLESFPIGSQQICDLMPKLIEEINSCETLRKRLFQVEFLTTTRGEALITLIYHRALDTAWQEKASELQIRLNCKLIGRSKKQKIVLSDDFVTEEFTVAGRIFSYQQVESGFTQPNAKICEMMLNWSCVNSKGFGGDLLELYCGNGNFTLPLSSNFNRVLATEVSKTSVNSARHNISVNSCNNIDVVRMSSEEFTQALNGEREFRRLRGMELNNYSFSSVFVDPPRAGLDVDTLNMISRFDNIIYISCNPETLKLNMETLTQSHRIKHFALFDQFPYTEHRECGVILTR
jgi:tRNA (uracil-5-)-methyltransferase